MLICCSWLDCGVGACVHGPLFLQSDGQAATTTIDLLLPISNVALSSPWLFHPYRRHIRRFVDDFTSMARAEKRHGEMLQTERSAALDGDGTGL